MTKSKIFSTSRFECYRDGLTIRGIEYRPSGDKLPIAIVSHGFMGKGEHFSQYAIKLAELGYCAYCFDFCGGSHESSSDGSTEDMTVLTEVRDLKAVISYAQSRPYTHSDNMLLMGCSQGGFVSALAAKELKKQVARLVLFYPALCIPDDARKGQMMFALFDPNDIPETIECGPMKLGRCYPAAVNQMDPYEEIKGFDGKVLIIHGTDDGIVKQSYAERAYEAYNSTVPDRASLHIIKGGGHGFTGEHDEEAICLLAEFAKI